MSCTDPNEVLSDVKSTNSVSTLLFDWDGTLVDSAHLGLAAFQETFAELGVNFRLDIYEDTYSPNWYTTYEALGLPKEKWPRADDLWRLHYEKQTARLIEGAADTLLALHRKGYRLGVVTSGNEGRVACEIKQSALANLFEVVICSEHIVNRKPHPEGLEIALARLSSKHEESAYVGDAPEDIQMGKRANLLTVGVRSNYPSSARLRVSAPDIYLESIMELSSHFPGVFELSSE
jgi:HAD superfamily hydrolase (TIGR01549 family)